MNKGLVISLIIVILVGIGVSRIKYEVVFLRKTLKTIENDMEKTSDDLRILEAEWSYLNDPKRLKKFCEMYLPNMKPMDSTQVVSYNKIIGKEYEEKFNDSGAFNLFLDKTILNDNFETEGDGG